MLFVLHKKLVLIMRMGMVVGLIGALSACMQGHSTPFAFADNSLAKGKIKAVDQVFKASFRGGDWFYQGAQAAQGQIDAYIQIPHKLDMKLEDQRNYLRQAICPAARHTDFWQQMQNVPLSVHIYSMHKTTSVKAQCVNPLQANSKAA